MTKFKDLEGRQYEAYLMDTRNTRIDTFDTWKMRIESARTLANGEFLTEHPGQKADVQFPYIMNLAEAMPRDVSRLVAESIPAVRAFPHNDSVEARTEAHVREGIGESEQIRRGIVLWLETKGVTPQKAKPERKRARTRKRS